MASTIPEHSKVRACFSYNPKEGRLKKLGRYGGTVRGKTVRFDGKKYPKLKFIWFWMTGEWQPVHPIDGDSTNTRLTNLSPQRRAGKIELPSVGELQSLFCYDPDSGELCSLESLEPITTRDSKGYLIVNMFGQRYHVHRIIWKLIYGEEPTVIEHIDGIKTNNRQNNLKERTT